MMALKHKQIIYDYDPQSDELTMTFGEARQSIAQEVDDEFFVQLDPETREVAGFSLLGFSKRVLAKNKMTQRFSIPVQMQGSLQTAV